MFEIQVKMIAIITIFILCFSGILRQNNPKQKLNVKALIVLNKIDGIKLL